MSVQEPAVISTEALIDYIGQWSEPISPDKYILDDAFLNRVLLVLQHSFNNNTKARVVNELKNHFEEQLSMLLQTHHKRKPGRPRKNDRLRSNSNLVQRANRTAIVLDFLEVLDQLKWKDGGYNKSDDIKIETHAMHNDRSRRVALLGILFFALAFVYRYIF